MLAAGCLQVCAFGGWSFLSTLIVGMQEFFGTSCWLAASRMQAGYWHIVVAARWIVAARWNFLCRNMALHVGTF